VIGHPIGHSLSPAMQNAAFTALGLDYCYVAFDVSPDDIPAALAGMRALNIVGFNVTIPHKPVVFRLVDRLDNSAQMVEAVNTVRYDAKGMVGYSTDAEGFVRPLESLGISLADKRIVIIGAGGAARSVAAACLNRGAGSIVVLNRTPEKGRELVDRLKRLAQPAAGHLPVLDAIQLKIGQAAVSEADLLVQCTSVGMSPLQDAPPPISPAWIRPDSVVYDLIYNPAETRLLAAARAIGATTINGVDMLVQQGAVAFQIWTGIDPPVDVMRRALLNGLGR